MQVLEVKTMPQAGRVLTLGWRLDTDDVRAPIGQVPDARGTRTRQREIQDAYPGQWQRGARRGLDHKTIDAPSSGDSARVRQQFPLATPLLKCTYDVGIPRRFGHHAVLVAFSEAARLEPSPTDAGGTSFELLGQLDGKAQRCQAVGERASGLHPSRATGHGRAFCSPA